MAQRIVSTETAYRGWLTVLRARVATQGGETVREIVVRPDAAAVLPYDPDRKVALLIRLPRAPALHAGGPDRLLEAPAGLVEDGETAEACVIREAEEEAGVRLGALAPVGRAFSTPGMTTERISLFLAAYAASDRVGAGGGAPGEDEDIELAEMGLGALWAQVQGGFIEDLKTLALVYALKAERPELFEETPR